VRIAVTGSIATDHLMTFPGRFADALLPEQLDRLSVSFLVDGLVVRRGGVGGNISYGLGLLGLRPLLVGAVGEDFADYRSWLERHGVDTSGVRVSASRHTARFVCTTDEQQNQIASFYPGAMAEAAEIALAELPSVDLVIVGANDPAAMLRHTAECRERGVAFAADPSQQLSTLADDAVRTLIEGAALLFSNAYEAALIEKRTGWSPEQTLSRVGAQVTTHGPDGTVVAVGARWADGPEAAGSTLRVGVVPAREVADPTGVGDAFRAGFLAGRSWGFGLERSAQVGSLMATLCLESVGPQEYALDRGEALDRLTVTYGAPAAEQIATRLTG
jgi:adenosine kinase